MIVETPTGIVLDIAGTAVLLNTTPKAIRQRIARRLLPFRKLGGRIVFLKAELEEFMRELPGCRLEEAQKNLEIRSIHGLD